MIRRRLADLVELEVQPRAEESAVRWVRGMPHSDGRMAPDIVWGAATSHCGRVTRDSADVWRGGRSGSELLAAIQVTLVERSATMLHASALEVAGSGIVVLGPTGSGKTLITLAALSRPDWQLLSDDLIVLHSNGTVSALPTPIALRSHHLPLLPDAIRRALEPRTRLSGASAVLARVPGARRVGRLLRNRLSTSRGRLAFWARTVRTDSIAVPPESVFQGEKLLSETTVRLVVVLSREGVDSGSFTDLEQVVGLAVHDTYRNEQIGDVLRDLDTSGELALPEHMQRFEEILTQGFTSADRIIHLTTSPQNAIADTQQHLIHAIESCLSP